MNSDNNVFKSTVGITKINKASKNEIKTKNNNNLLKKNKLKVNVNFNFSFSTEKKNNNLKLNNKTAAFNDNELNSLTYYDALKYDKRTYFKYYLSLLKVKHLFIFSFCPNKDYNSPIIKFFLFFFLFNLPYIKEYKIH